MEEWLIRMVFFFIGSTMGALVMAFIAGANQGRIK